MKFIDSVRVFLSSGAGGNGCSSFRREKFIESGGPDGGDGGKGGDVIIKGSSRLNTLVDFRYRPHQKAGTGQSGRSALRSGKAGDDLVVELPLGTEILDENGFVIHEILKDDESFTLIEGGAGGLGNARFKSSVNQSPHFASKGKAGTEKKFFFQLKLIADIGVIGLPNAGKSTFLSVVSNAKPKIADYPFTTLSPNLGVVDYNFKTLVFADIPGLIEGASEGLGLGHDFLKHIQKCVFLLHLVDINTPDIEYAVQTIHQELGAFDESLLDKPRLLIFTKCENFYIDKALIGKKKGEEAFATQLYHNQPKLKRWLKKEGYESMFFVSSHAKIGLKSLVETVFNYYDEHEIQKVRQDKKWNPLES